MAEKPPQIDLEPRRHSHLYELKPISRWWIALTSGLVAFGVWGNGITNPASWFLVLAGALWFGAVVLSNPRKWLSKLKD